METSRAISSRAQQQSQAENLDQDDDVSESEEESGGPEEEIRELEEEVHQMAEKIVDYRNTLPGQLKSTLDSILAAQRPVLDTRTDEGPESQPGCSNDPPTFDIDGRAAALAGEVPNEAEKVQLLKRKISSNASAIPIVLNRMKEGMARIDKLQSSNKVIHPAFKRARTS